MAQSPMVSNISLPITVAKLGEGYLAFTTIGTVRVSGGRRNNAYEATCSLFAVLAGTSGDNSAAAVAIELLIAGYSLDDFEKLTTGETK